jgi:putative tRNA adenosine deaminase-associated protein
MTDDVDVPGARDDGDGYLEDLQTGGVDFAIAAFRGDAPDDAGGEGSWDAGWQVAAMVPAAGDDLDSLLGALRQLSGGGEVLGFVSVSDDFFVLARVGAATRLFLSDITAALEWQLAADVLDALDIEPPDEDEDLDDEVETAGDLAIFADLGLSEMELAVLCADLDLYPDEVLGSITARLGFGDQFQRAAE